MDIEQLLSELEQCKKALQGEIILCDSLRSENKALKAENIRLQAIIDEANAQKPVLKQYRYPIKIADTEKQWTSWGKWVGGESMVGAQERKLYARPIPAQQSPAVAVPDEINWMHPKLQSLLSQKARYDYQLRLFDQILSDDWDGEFCYPDQEYTTSSHERLVKILADKSTRITEQDLIETLEAFVESKYVGLSAYFAKSWTKSEEGLALLEKLNK